MMPQSHQTAYDDFHKNHADESKQQKQQHQLHNPNYDHLYHQIDSLSSSFAQRQTNYTPSSYNAFSYGKNSTYAARPDNIVQYCLNEKDLSKAGFLFAVSNDALLEDFPSTIEMLKNIIDSKSYINNLNEQSIVEIVLTRCISALRETKLIEKYYDDLLELVDICLKYNLNNGKNRNSLTSDFEVELNNQSMTSSSSPTSTNTPHANIVSDILSCILLDYLDPDLAVKVIPICIKILQHHNVKPELLREICSYLNLVACRMPEYLVDYVYYIVSALLKGHHCLSHLLYQICESNIECIYPLTRHLVKSLKFIKSTKDLIYILQIMYLVSLNHVQLLLVHLEDLIEYLFDENFQEYILDIFYTIANQIPIALEPYLFLFGKTNYYDSYKVDKIISTVGRSLKKKAEFCTNLLIERIRLEANKTRNKKMNSLNNRMSYCTNEKNNISSFKDSTEKLEYEEYLLSASQNRNHYKKSNSYAYSPYTRLELDPYLHYQNMDNNNNVVSVADSNKKYVQILTEIYSIAQVYPHVLDTCLKPICELFYNPSDSIKEIIDHMKHLQSESSSRNESNNEIDLSRSDGINLSNINNSQGSFEDNNSNELKLDRKIKSMNSNNDAEDEDDDDDEDDADPDKQNIDENNYKIDDFIKKFDVNLNFLNEVDDNNNVKANDEYTSQKEKDFEFKYIKKYGTGSEKHSCNSEAIKSDAPVYHKPGLVISDTRSFSLLKTRIIEEPENEENVTQSKDSTEEKSYSNLYSSIEQPLLTKLDDSSEANKTRSSLFRTLDGFENDVVQQFCTKHLDKIKNYIDNISKLLPIPVAPTEEMIIKSVDFRNKSSTDFFSKKFKYKKYCTLYFKCLSVGPHCLYNNNYFELITFFPSIWIHLIFLSIQSKMAQGIRQKDQIFILLKLFYEKLNEKTPFVALMTSSFPSEKKITELVEELRDSRIYDLFEFKDSLRLELPDANSNEELIEKNQWLCYLCSNPSRVNELCVERPLIQGQLKEKHGRWKFLKRWHKRFFTLTGGSIVYFKKDMRQESLNVRYIRNIQTLKHTNSSPAKSRTIPTAFEIFTDRNSFILKAQNSNEAQQWIQYLQISKAIENSRDSVVVSPKVITNSCESSL